MRIVNGRNEFWSAVHWYRRQIDWMLLAVLTAFMLAMGLVVAVWWAF